MQMNNEQIILAVENFKFRIFDSVPKPESDRAYVLYQGNGKKENILVITSGKPVLSSQIKTGGFDKKMTVSTAVRQYEAAKSVSDQTGNYKFMIDIVVYYKIRDIEHVFRQKRWNIDEMVENYVFQIIKSVHKQYDIDSQIELENELVEMVLRIFKEKMGYLDITDYKIAVDVDERAKRIMDAALDNMADTFVMEKEREKGIAEIEGKKQLEIKKLEAEKEIESKRNDVTLTMAEGFNAIRDKIGEDSAVAFLAYVRGEISGVELDDRIRNNKNSTILSTITTLKQLADLEVLSGTALEQAAMKLIGQASVDIGQASVEDEDYSYMDSEVY